MNIKQSETVVIKRSQINFAPYNPKTHSKQAIETQKKNFKKVGFLGGIVWNATTNNLVSGHKRVMALDLVNGYDGTEQTDYDVKVERVEMDNKTEKEQNIFMDAQSTNTKQDYRKIAEIINDIDYTLAGLTDNDLNIIEAVSPAFSIGNDPIQQNDIDEIATVYKEKKDSVKKAKAEQKQKAIAAFEGDSYVILSFNNYENKVAFMERMGFEITQKYIQGEMFSEKIERVE